jgi:hypothetical protein
MTVITPFMIIVICIAAVLLVTGIILLAKNIKPIMGFFFLVFAIALLIGVLMDPKNFQYGVTSAWNAIGNIF